MAALRRKVSGLDDGSVLAAAAAGLETGGMARQSTSRLGMSLNGNNGGGALKQPQQQQMGLPRIIGGVGVSSLSATHSGGSMTSSIAGSSPLVNTVNSLTSRHSLLTSKPLDGLKCLSCDRGLETVERTASGQAVPVGTVGKHFYSVPPAGGFAGGDYRLKQMGPPATASNPSSSSLSSSSGMLLPLGSVPGAGAGAGPMSGRSAGTGVGGGMSFNVKRSVTMGVNSSSSGSNSSRSIATTAATSSSSLGSRDSPSSLGPS